MFHDMVWVGWLIDWSCIVFANILIGCSLAHLLHGHLEEKKFVNAMISKTIAEDINNKRL